MNCILIFFASSLVLGYAQFSPNNIDQVFNSFKSTYGKDYSSPLEESYRKSLFTSNYRSISSFNAGSHSYKQGINQFTDMTDAEVAEYGLRGLTAKNYNWDNEVRTKSSDLYLSNNTKQSNENLDYRSSGSVSRVKDQGRCGSCWAFSALGSLEGVQHKSRNVMNTQSEQELVDCFKRNCDGEWPTRAFDFMINQQKIAMDSSSCYPYTSGNGRAGATCRGYDTNCIGAVPVQKVQTAQHDEADLKAHLDNAGPLSVTIYITRGWSRYSRGVFDDPNCRQNNNGLHAVTLVGYGIENGVPFWLIKNSWGSRWGDGGYIKMARNKNNQCNIASWGVYATV